MFRTGKFTLVHNQKTGGQILIQFIQSYISDIGYIGYFENLIETIDHGSALRVNQDASNTSIISGL
jgi:hypothetical protein